MRRPSHALMRDLAEFGAAVRDWRKIQRLTAQEVADRSGITRSTSRGIETGQERVQMGSVFRVLRVLGLNGEVLEAIDPERSEIFGVASLEATYRSGFDNGAAIGQHWAPCVTLGLSRRSFRGAMLRRSCPRRWRLTVRHSLSLTVTCCSLSLFVQ